MTGSVSESHVYQDVTFEVSTLEFYIEAFTYYCELLEQRLKVMQENVLASKLLDDKALMQTPLSQELTRAQSVVQMLQNRIDNPKWKPLGDNADSVTMIHRYLDLQHKTVRYIKSVASLYLKYLKSERDSFARSSKASKTELEPIDARIRVLDEKITGGVFDDADLVDLPIDIPEDTQNDEPIPIPLSFEVFVDIETIEQLRDAQSKDFNLSKLVRLCEELNRCYASECYYAVAMLVRTVLNHIPPVFGYTRFSEVANNYGGAGVSFRKCMQHLEESSRRIADSYAHQTIRDREVLPTRSQVNFSSDLAFLLSEVVRVLS